MDVFIREKVCIAPQCPSQFHVAVILKLLLQGFRRVIDRGEVKAQHHIAVALVGGLAANVGAAEDLLKLVSPMAVIIVLQHGHPAGLAETSGTDQESEALVLQRANEARFVHIEAAFQPNGPEIGPAVGNERVRSGHDSFTAALGGLDYNRQGLSRNIITLKSLGTAEMSYSPIGMSASAA